MKFEFPFYFVESVTFGDRITKYVRFDKIPVDIVDSGVESVKSYLIANHLLKTKRPYGLLRNENLLILSK